jgi:hypothetical protein
MPCPVSCSSGFDVIPGSEAEEYPEPSLQTAASNSGFSAPNHPPKGDSGDSICPLWARFKGVPPPSSPPGDGRWEQRKTQRAKRGILDGLAALASWTYGPLRLHTPAPPTISTIIKSLQGETRLWFAADHHERDIVILCRVEKMPFESGEDLPKPPLWREVRN